jgi:hypothetical protein
MYVMATHLPFCRICIASESGWASHSDAFFLYFLLFSPLPNHIRAASIFGLYAYGEILDALSSWSWETLVGIRGRNGLLQEHVIRVIVQQRAYSNYFCIQCVNLFFVLICNLTSCVKIVT